MDIRKITILSMFLSISIILSIIDSYVSRYFFTFAPGVKLGLANITTIFLLYTFTKKDAATLVVLRILLISLFLGNFNFVSFMLSLSGATLSLSFMIFAKRTNLLSVIGVSIIGAVSHICGQIFMAMIILSIPEVIYYIPISLIIVIPTGIVTGIISNTIIKYYENNYLEI